MVAAPPAPAPPVPLISGNVPYGRKSFANTVGPQTTVYTVTVKHTAITRLPRSRGPDSLSGLGGPEVSTACTYSDIQRPTGYRYQCPSRIGQGAGAMMYATTQSHAALTLPGRAAGGDRLGRLGPQPPTGRRALHDAPQYPIRTAEGLPFYLHPHPHDEDDDGRTIVHWK